ncbi:hypothetical protein D3C84_895720 [compost metagenome]
MNHIANCQLDNLAALCTRNIGYLQDLGRHVARRGVFADLLFDPHHQVIVEWLAVAQFDEQYNACIALPLLADH